MTVSYHAITRFQHRDVRFTLFNSKPASSEENRFSGNPHAPASLLDYMGAPALILPRKQGDIYVLDRRTRQPLTQIGTIEVPGDGVEPAQRVSLPIGDR